MKTAFTLTIGAMAPKMKAQLPAGMPKETVERYQKLHDSLVMVGMHSIVSEAEYAKAKTRLFKRIEADVRKLK